MAQNFVWFNPLVPRGTLIPLSNNAYDLGSSAKAFRSAYLGTNLYFTAASSKIVPGATSLLFRNNADNATNITISDAGLLTLRNNISFSAASDLTTTTGAIRVKSTDNQVIFNANNADRWRISTAGVLTQDATNGGNIIVSKSGTSIVSGATSINADVTAIATPQFFSFGTLGVAALRGTADTTGSAIALLKSRATDGTANTIIVNGDEVGTINFYGSNGATFDLAAQIAVKIDGSPGATTDMPGRIEFLCSADGSATPARRWYIANNGDMYQDSSGGGNIVFGRTGNSNVYSTAGSAMGIGTNANQKLLLRANGSDRWSVETNGNFQQDATNGGVLVMTKALTGLAEPTGTLAALGSTQTDAAAITTTVTQVTAVDGTKGVKLPALSSVTTGQTLVIINSSTTSALKYYTNASGETVFGQSGTTAISLAAKGMAICKKYDSTNWYCSHLAAPF